MERCAMSRPRSSPIDTSAMPITAALWCAACMGEGKHIHSHGCLTTAGWPQGSVHHRGAVLRRLQCQGSCFCGLQTTLVLLCI